MEVLKLAARLTTREPRILLDPELKPGRYRVTLVIAGASGESAAAELGVTILKPATTDGDVVLPVRPIGGVVAPTLERPVLDLDAPLIATPGPRPLPRDGAVSPVSVEPVKPKSRRKPK